MSSELQRTSFELHQTSSELQRTGFELHQTSSELQRTSSELHQMSSKLERTSSELHQESSILQWIRYRPLKVTNDAFVSVMVFFEGTVEKKKPQTTE
ncbi:hypothetical protein [Flavobacterium sp.]|uniref:hypothetical protein n=1 Tax=Flavobacterium sp. TaxID=239 RepID=UPI003D0ED109